MQASPIDDKVAAFKAAVEQQAGAAALSKPPSDPPTAADANTSYLLSLMASLGRIASEMDTPNTVNNVEMQINQIMSAYSAPAVRKAGHDLLNEVYAERKSRAEAADTEMQALLKHLSDVVAKADKPQDLDDVFVQLQKIVSNRYGYYAENQALYQNVSTAFEFTKLWQDYLSRLNSGQMQLAMTDLQNVNQNNYGAGIIPRSQLLARISASMAATTGKGTGKDDEAPPEVANILQGIKSLDDMEPALRRLSELPQTNPQVAKAYSNLALVVQVYTRMKASLPQITNLNFVENSQLNISPALQARLLVFILQHYFDSYQGAAPGPDEKPQAYVDRVIADAISRQDWPLLRKALAGQTYLNRNSALTVYAGGGVSAGIDNLLAGVNQEAAAQYVLAVCSYQNALKLADMTVTAKLIGEKLDGIKRDHPKEYQEGMQLVMAPPVSRSVPAGPTAPNSPPPPPPVPSVAPR